MSDKFFSAKFQTIVFVVIFITLILVVVNQIILGMRVSTLFNYTQAIGTAANYTKGPSITPVPSASVSAVPSIATKSAVKTVTPLRVPTK